MRATALAAALVLAATFVSSCSSGMGAPSTSISASTAPQRLASAQQRMLAARYLAIATPANARLDDAVDGFRDHQSRDLPAAVADLKEQAAIERSFDRQLQEIAFPVQIKTVAASLVRANEVRADLAIEAATSSTLPALATFAPVRAAADADVEQQVNVIRHQLGLPPADQD